MQLISTRMDILPFQNQFSQEGKFPILLSYTVCYYNGKVHQGLRFFFYYVWYSAHDSPETIELEINTGSSDGLILWQGVVSPGPVFFQQTDPRFSSKS